jgi:hypothetical protein
MDRVPDNLGFRALNMSRIESVGLRPEAVAILGLNQLRNDTELAGFSADGSFEDGARMQGAADLANIGILALEDECRSPGDDSQRSGFGEGFSQFVSDAVAEEIPIRISGQIEEGSTASEGCAGPEGGGEARSSEEAG